MEFTKINNDINGNPRYVSHFLNFITDKESEGLTLDQKYNLAVKKAKKIGGKIYRGKSFGGGIVFQSYNIQETLKKVKGA
jgi:hypothetical protein